MSEVMVTLKSLPLHCAPAPLLAVYVRVTQAVGPPANSTTAAATGAALCSTAMCTNSVCIATNYVCRGCLASKLHKSCLKAEYIYWTVEATMSNVTPVLSLQEGSN